LEKNFDEELLINKRVNIKDEQDIRSQILRILVYDIFKLYETYTIAIKKFGYVQAFVNIKEAKALHYSELISYLEKYQIDVPINNWINKIEVGNSYIEVCEIGVASEIKNIAMYDNLLQYAQDEDIKDLLYKLQASSYNIHLPDFRNSVMNYYGSKQISLNGFNQEELMKKLGEYQGMFDDIMSGNIDQNKISELFSKINISMVGGAVFGAAAIAFLNSYMENKNKE